jgi:DNA-directed RNA polymerase subunit M/transcription elongation factor TFIIS
MKKRDKRSSTLLQRAEQSEARAKAAMDTAKLAYKEAVAAYQAIGVVVTELQTRNADRPPEIVKCNECGVEEWAQPFPGGWAQTGKNKNGGIASYCPAHC